ncbi:hypothetical protein NQ317_019698, partial [Molorchus minor]
MPQTDLSSRDLETSCVTFAVAEFSFELFKDHENKVDGTLLGKFMYNCNVNPSQETLKKYGLAEKEGQKKFTYEELLPIISELKKDVKDQGCYEDFIECLKLYDKDENGQMQAGELSNSLMCLGEKLSDAEVDQLFDDCLDEEDDEGNIEYI